MKQNVGGRDRLARLSVGVILGIVGLALLAGYVPGGRLVGAIVLLAAAVLLVTGWARRCPVNGAAGIDTSK